MSDDKTTLQHLETAPISTSIDRSREGRVAEELRVLANHVEHDALVDPHEASEERFGRIKQIHEHVAFIRARADEIDAGTGAYLYEKVRFLCVHCGRTEPDPDLVNGSDWCSQCYPDPNEDSTDRAPGYYWVLPSPDYFAETEWASSEWKVVQWNPNMEWPVRIGFLGYKECVIAKWGRRVPRHDDPTATLQALLVARPYVEEQALARRDEGQNNDAMQALMLIDEVISAR